MDYHQRSGSEFYELPPGKYHFQVQAIRRDGMPSSQMAEASFEIRAPFL